MGISRSLCSCREQVVPAVSSAPLTGSASVIEDVIAPQPAQVDQAGELPREGIAAPGKAGVLGLLSAPEAGGAGGTLADEAQVIEALAGACGSTAMVVLMHYSATAVLEAHGDEATRRAAPAHRLRRVAHPRRHVQAFPQDTLHALGSGRADATARVLQVKAVAAEAAADIADGVLKLCGGAAFRKHLVVERHFRDALAARVMAPATEALRDFVGRAALGLPLF